MRCAGARRAWHERELGVVVQPHDRALDAHLAACPACAAWTAAERRLLADLARLHDEPPFTIDVVARVQARIAAVAPPERLEVSPRELGWASALACAAAIILGALLWRALPEWSPLVAGGLDLAGGLAGAGVAVGRSLVDLVGVLLLAGRDLAASLAALFRLDRLGAFALPAITFCHLLLALSLVVAARRHEPAMRGSHR